MKKNKYTNYLLYITLLALVLRIAKCLLKNRISKDSANYIYMAEHLANGNFIDAFSFNTRIPPLYSYLISLGIKLGFDPIFAGLAVSVICGALTVIPIYFIARKIMNEKLALLAAFFAATHPYLIRSSGEIMRDPLCMFLLFTSLAFAVYATEVKWSRFWYLSGLFAGLTVLVRSEGVELFLAAFIWIVIEMALLMRRKFRQKDSSVQDNSDSGAKSIIHYVSCIFTFVVTYLLVTIPVQMALVKTPSTWTVVDTRTVSFIEGFFTLPEDDIVDGGH